MAIFLTFSLAFSSVQIVPRPDSWAYADWSDFFLDKMKYFR